MNGYDTTPRELGWDDEIQRDESFQVLPEGDYAFTVSKFERGRHGGSAKVPPCNKAILTIAVASPAGSGQIAANLFLHTNFEWKLCQFFTAIGQRRHGEPLRMNWNTVAGSTGVCHVGVRKWTGNDGRERESNEITEFYDPAKAPRIEAVPADKSGPTPPGGIYGQQWTELPQGTPTPWSSGSF